MGKYVKSLKKSFRFTIEANSNYPTFWSGSSQIIIPNKWQ